MSDTPDNPFARWQRLFGQLFDAHPGNVAMLATDGTILAVNAGWRAYGRFHKMPAGYDCVGQNYLAACEAGAVAGHPMAREAYVGLLEVLQAGRPKFTLVYPCHTPTHREWCRMWIEPQTPSVPVAIVAHQVVRSERVEPIPVADRTPFVSAAHRSYDARRWVRPAASRAMAACV